MKKIVLILITGFIIFLLGFYLLYSKYYTPNSRIKELNEFRNVDNNKAIAWISIQGTNIDMPIMYKGDVTDITDPTYNIGWTYNSSKKQTSRIIVYSHNMRNISSHPLIADKNQARFEQLMSFIYTSFTKKNKYIQYTMNGRDYLYKIYAVSLQKTDDLDEDEGNISEQNKDLYVEQEKNNSIFKFDTDVSRKDNLLTLVTCTRFYKSSDHYSFIMDAREVRKNEKIKNYNVKEKSEYKSIKKILEGDGKNE